MDEANSDTKRDKFNHKLDQLEQSCIVKSNMGSITVEQSGKLVANCGTSRALTSGQRGSRLWRATIVRLPPSCVSHPYVALYCIAKRLDELEGK